jgi:RES domain-containing protein
LTAQVLDRTLTAYRIGDPDGAYPIFDATGSQFVPGRWNTADATLIYASEHYSTALLEKLANGLGDLPPNQHFIEITIDAGVSYEVFPEARHPGWDSRDQTVARAFGRAWRLESRSAILLAPSVVARVERNILINPAHPEFARIRASLHQPVWWDDRLFAPSAARR